MEKNEDSKDVQWQKILLDSQISQLSSGSSTYEQFQSVAMTSNDDIPESTLKFTIENLTNLLSVNKDVFKHQRFNELRTLVTKLHHRISGYKALKRTVRKRVNELAQKAIRSRMQRLKDLDRQRISQANLRKKRLKQLSQLKKDSAFQHSLSIKAAAEPLPSCTLPSDDCLSEDEPVSEDTFFSRTCYICKGGFSGVHHFYEQLCPECAEWNFDKRHIKADLTGKVVLLTGARVKIGFECGKRLLECGATLIATSRFPYDCAKRYSQLENYNNFKDRIHIYGLDMKDIRAVIRLTELIKNRFSQLDVIINNAAQTIRRPPAYYAHLVNDEKQSNQLSIDVKGLVDGDAHKTSSLNPAKYSDDQLVSAGQEISSSDVSQMAMMQEDSQIGHQLFPKGVLDHDGQQLDLRTKNSWTLLLDQVEPTEMVEVFAVNVAPFIMNSRLKSLMAQNSDSDKYIINVSAMEGKFNRFKNPTHPHTNMAKAALNMMTRTCAHDYSKSNIFMNSVDTGWINDEYPFQEVVRRAEKKGFVTPLDEIDAMARILHPIFDGFTNGHNVYGKFLKDFEETDW